MVLGECLRDDRILWSPHSKALDTTMTLEDRLWYPIPSPSHPLWKEPCWLLPEVTKMASEVGKEACW